MTTTITTPTQTPALNIPAIASQLLNVTAIANMRKMILVKLNLLIFYFFKIE